jgi:Tfp pilus assembly protein PilE
VVTRSRQPAAEECPERDYPVSAGARRGLTLIDMSITLLIMGIMLAAAVPRYSNLLQTFRADAASKRIAADLSLARERAIGGSASQTVTFDQASSSYTLTGITNPDHMSVPYRIVLTDPPYNVTMSALSVGSDKAVVFDIYGKPDAGGTVTVKSGSKLKIVTIDAYSGKVTIQ